MDETDDVGVASSEQAGPENVLLHCDSPVGEGPAAVDPESRSLSMDSAYGTLSPQSLTTLKLKAGLGVGPETGAGQSEDDTEAEYEDEEDVFEVEEEEEEEVDEDDATAWNGSQVTVNEAAFLEDGSQAAVNDAVFLDDGRDDGTSAGSLERHLVARQTRAASVAAGSTLSLRRRSPVQSPRPAHRSHSEDDLLRRSDRNHGNHHSSPSCFSKPSSRSVELLLSGEGSGLRGVSAALSGPLLRARVREVSRTLSCPSAPQDEQDEQDSAPPSGHKEKRSHTASQQQKKKLTRAQLQRLRTSMVLNSTLTAS